MPVDITKRPDIMAFEKQQEGRLGAQQRALTGKDSAGRPIANNIQADSDLIGQRTRRLMPERNQAIERRIGRL